MRPIDFLQNLVWGKMLRPQLKDNGDFANNASFDTQGMSAVAVAVFMGDTDVAAGDAVGSGGEDVALKLEESDDNSTFADITDAALSDSIQHDDDNKIFLFLVDKSKTRKRYLRVHEPHSAAGAALGSNLAILAIGFPDGPCPNSNTLRGVEELILV